MSYGSMGGDGQPQFQAQVFTRIAAGQSLADAVAAPRLLWGRTWGADSVTVKVEAAYDDAVAAALARRGHEIERLRAGRARTLSATPARCGAARKGEIAATHDPRADGGALGV